jgi:hypothetical protein
VADAKFVANGRPLGGRSGILLRLVGESESFRGPAPVFILLGITMTMVRYLKSCFMGCPLQAACASCRPLHEENCRVFYDAPNPRRLPARRDELIGPPLPVPSATGPACLVPIGSPGVFPAFVHSAHFVRARPSNLRPTASIRPPRRRGRFQRTRPVAYRAVRTDCRWAAPADFQYLPWLGLRVVSRVLVTPILPGPAVSNPTRAVSHGTRTRRQFVGRWQYSKPQSRRSGPGSGSAWDGLGSAVRSV